ncbi:MAG: (2Fe-2S)-binding protein [Pseudohongiellaceae bacterium]
MIELTVNGEPVKLDVEPEMPLLWVLRNELGLTGTKFGCGIAACGACTVHLDGEAVRSCVTPVSAIGDRPVTTIESLSQPGGLTAVQQAWIDHQVPQCGYCQSGMVMAVSAALDNHPDASDEELFDTVSNVCRCGTYPRVANAIRSLRADRGETA